MNLFTYILTFVPTKQYYENSSKQIKKFDKETATIKMNKQILELKNTVTELFS